MHGFLGSSVGAGDFELKSFGMREKVFAERFCALRGDRKEIAAREAFLGFDGRDDFFGSFGPEALQGSDGAVLASSFKSSKGGDSEFFVESFYFLGAETL